jgi:hypothetical protein
MRTLPAFALAATAVLAAAAPAAAKELSLTVCGAEDCASLTDAPELRALVSLAPGKAQPSSAAYFGGTLRASGSAGIVRSFLYVPSTGVMRVFDATAFWTTVPAPLRAVLDRATSGLEPYAAASPAEEDFPVWPALVATAVALALVAAALRRVRRRRLAAVGIAALAVLALAGLASAKGYGHPQLCGPAACTAPAAWLSSLPAGEAPVVPAPAPFYELRLGPSWRVWYVPSARAIAPRAGTTFTLVTDEAAAALDRLAARVKPFAAPDLRAAFVGGRRVSGDADTYRRLFELESSGQQANRGADWVPIDLRSKRESPWTNGATYLAYSASANLLQRGPERFRLPARIAARLERAAPLA